MAGYDQPRADSQMNKPVRYIKARDLVQPDPARTRWWCSLTAAKPLVVISGYSLGGHAVEKSPHIDGLISCILNRKTSSRGPAARASSSGSSGISWQQTPRTVEASAHRCHRTRLACGWAEEFQSSPTGSAASTADDVLASLAPPPPFSNSERVHATDPLRIDQALSASGGSSGGDSLEANSIDAGFRTPAMLQASDGTETDTFVSQRTTMARPVEIRRGARVPRYIFRSGRPSLSKPPSLAFAAIRQAKTIKPVFSNGTGRNKFKTRSQGNGLKSVKPLVSE